jgi:hypothetical protein
MVLSSWLSNTISFINREGVELFKIGKDKTGADTYDTVYIKDNNSVAVSSGFGGNRCIIIIDMYQVNHNRSLYDFHSLCSKVCLEM